MSPEAEALVELWEIILTEVKDAQRNVKAAQCLNILLDMLDEDF